MPQTASLKLIYKFPTLKEVKSRLCNKIRDGAFNYHKSSSLVSHHNSAMLSKTTKAKQLI